MTNTSLPAREKITRDRARNSLSRDQQTTFDGLVDSVGRWSTYFYGTKFVSYAILAELVRDGWQKTPG